MFLDGAKKTISFPSVKPKVQPLQREVAAAPTLNPTKRNRADHSAPPASRRRSMVQLYTSFLRFLFSNFRHSLTLFSKFFASFPHGTCALSVSHQYLAFDGIYHRLGAAIPNNSTQRYPLQTPGKREYHPLRCPLPRDFAQRISASASRPQFGALAYADSHGELMTVQSPLLRQSLLVSFPPLIYMLKFSGSTCLI